MDGRTQDLEPNGPGLETTLPLASSVTIPETSSCPPKSVLYFLYRKRIPRFWLRTWTLRIKDNISQPPRSRVWSCDQILPNGDISRSDVYNFLEASLN